MITKGIIKSIDLLGNTCTVHIPFFETAGNDPIIETATVSNTPGSYNGYKVGDVVYVAFEDGSMSTPVVIGKLYLGTEKEKADPRGVSNVEESATAKKATLPADSKLTAEIDSNVPNTTVPYNSLSSIANGLNTLNTNVGQMDRDYGNRFKQVISNADGLKSEIEQTAEKMVAKVSGYETDTDGNPILDKPTEFGWNLQEDSWSVFNQDKTILTADKDGLHISGQVDAESGHIADFLIKDNGIVSYTTTTNENDETTETPWIIDFDNEDQKPSSDKGVYIGIDGIRLGQKFSVDNQGNVSASSLTIGQDQVSGLSDSLQNATDSAVSSVNSNFGVKDGELEGTIRATNLEITDANISGILEANKINVAGLTAEGVKVVKKDANEDPIIVDGKEVIVFNANAKNGTVEMSGFTVTENRLSAGEDSTFISLGPGNTKPEYITFTGNQIMSFQYDSDFFINYFDDTIEIKAQLTASTANQIIFGYWDESANCVAALYAHTNHPNIRWHFSTPDGRVAVMDTGISRDDRQVHTYKIKQKALYVDGIYKNVAYMADTLRECPIDIGGAYYIKSDGTSVGYTSFLRGNIYSVKITRPEGQYFWATNTNVSEWVPDIRGTEYGLRLINSIVTDDEYVYNFEAPIQGTLTGPQVDREAIYLGSENPKTAPFSVTNTGELTATKGKIGGFELDTFGMSLNKTPQSADFNLSAYSNSYSVCKTMSAEAGTRRVSIAKITFTQPVSTFRCYITNLHPNPAAEALTLTSVVNPPKIPTSITSTYTYSSSAKVISSSQGFNDLYNYHEIHYYNLKKDDYIYIVHISEQGSTGYFALPYSEDDNKITWKWEPVNNPSNTNFEDGTKPTITSWGATNTILVGKSAQLTVGSNFSVTGRGVLKATAGDIGPFNITDQMLWYNFNGYKRNSQGKLESSYNQKNKVYWQGDTFNLESTKKLEKDSNGNIVDEYGNLIPDTAIEGEYRTRGKLKTITSLSATEGVKSTNLKKLVYNSGKWIESTAVSCLTVTGKNSATAPGKTSTAPAITGILTIPVMAKAGPDGYSNWQKLDEAVLGNLIPFGGMIFYTQRPASSTNGADWFDVYACPSLDVSIKWFSAGTTNQRRYHSVHYKCGNGYNAESFNKNCIATLVLFGTIFNTT